MSETERTCKDGRMAVYDGSTRRYVCSACRHIHGSFRVDHSCERCTAEPKRLEPGWLEVLPW